MIFKILILFGECDFLDWKFGNNSFILVSMLFFKIGKSIGIVFFSYGFFEIGKIFLLIRDGSDVFCYCIFWDFLRVKVLFL